MRTSFRNRGSKRQDSLKIIELQKIRVDVFLANPLFHLKHYFKLVLFLFWSLFYTAGWQPGIQESAADWDEDWDKFEDEGKFNFLLTLWWMCLKHFLISCQWSTLVCLQFYALIWTCVCILVYVCYCGSIMASRHLVVLQKLYFQ